jgi:hypothetical protein
MREEDIKVGTSFTTSGAISTWKIVALTPAGNAIITADDDPYFEGIFKRKTLLESRIILAPSPRKGWIAVMETIGIDYVMSSNIYPSLERVQKKHPTARAYVEVNWKE